MELLILLCILFTFSSFIKATNLYSSVIFERRFISLYANCIASVIYLAPFEYILNLKSKRRSLISFCVKISEVSPISLIVSFKVYKYVKKEIENKSIGYNNEVRAIEYRTEWIIDNEIPIFKGEGRKYIDDLIFVGED